MAATFSYAQAAKGVVAPQASVKSSDSNAEPKPNEQNTDDIRTEGAEAAPQEELSNETEKPTADAGDESEWTVATNSKANPSGANSPGTSSASTAPKDEASNAANGTSESTWDKQSQASGAEKQSDEANDTKEKKNAEKEKKEPPKELKVAPLPAVNIWHQRREAQDARVKAVSSVKPSGSTAKSGASKTASSASSTSGDAPQEQPKGASKKKANDTEGPRDRKGAKGREDGSNLPPVGDATMWPTPQVAQGEEKRKAQEKTTTTTDKPEKSPAARSHGKEKWMPVPYVPTAVFNTPLPTAARRGGRAARGGRDNTRSGSHGATGAAADKAAAGQAAQGSAKQTPSAERGRNEQNSARANSLPAPSKRSNSTEAGLPDARKPATDRRGPKGGDNANAAPAARHGGEGYPRHRDAKPFARNQEASNKGADANSRNPHLSVDSHNGPRPGSTNERRFENGPKSADFGGFHGDRKEKDFAREGRFERSRGSHRGRGGYGGSQNSHFPNNHMSHHTFMHPKSFGFNDRQRSQQHSMPNGSQNHRMPLRSPSLPNSAAMYGVYPFPADINTMYGYHPMHAGPMTAIPYQQYMEPFSLMSMISMQLEYYFSVDNLCKDLFLRKHMDTQGFVALSFIASFKRIKSLTEDFELLRHVSRQLRNVDYVCGEDGVDRLRPRDKWEQWVFPVDQRDLSAQHDGPSFAPSSGQSDEHVNGTTNGVSHQHLSNGTAEPHVPKTSLSSTAPEFSPSNALNAQTEVANVRLSFQLFHCQ